MFAFGDDILEDLRIDHSIISSLLHLKPKQCPCLKFWWLIATIHLHKTKSSQTKHKATNKKDPTRDQGLQKHAATKGKVHLPKHTRKETQSGFKLGTFF